MSKSAGWLSASLTTRPDQLEVIDEVLLELGALAITYTDARDQPVLEPLPGTMPLWSELNVIALFYGDADTHLLALAFGEHMVARGGNAPEIRFERVAERDWVRVWMRDSRPMAFGQRLWVIPSNARQTNADGRDDAKVANSVDVYLDPGLAFGTGTHPTTAMCLRWLDRNIRTGERVIDYGCGSGVLAIAAVRLGAVHCIAIDIDDQALIATRENATNNGIEGQIDTRAPAPRESVSADIVVANILQQPLIDLAPTLALMVVSPGWLVLSGLLETQAERVISAYQPWVELAVADQQEGWCLLTGSRNAG